MVNYPIRVPRSYYSGSNPRKLEKRAEHNNAAAVLEGYINSEIERRGPGVFHYHLISHAVGIPLEQVSKILFPVDCGHNGLTVSHGVDGEPAEFFKSMMKNQPAPPSASETPHPPDSEPAEPPSP